MYRPLLFCCVLALILCQPVSASPPDQADEIAAHLGFLGYETTTSEEFLRASHPSNLNVALKEHRGGILLLSFLGGSAYAKENPEKLMELANSMNVVATVSRSYVDKDGDLALEAWYPGSYEKTRFGLFIEEWHRDTIVQLRDRSEEIEGLIE